MNQMEMLEAARREYHEDQVQPTALAVLQPGNDYLRDVVNDYLEMMQGQTNKTKIACFYELKSIAIHRHECLRIVRMTSKFAKKITLCMLALFFRWPRVSQSSMYDICSSISPTCFANSKSAVAKLIAIYV
jgi:hypothetical protein